MRAVHVKMVVATILLGSYLVVSKLVLREVSVFSATFVRLVAAAAVLGVYLRVKGAGPTPRPGRRDGAVIFAQAFIGVFLFSVFAMYGVKYTGAIEAGVILGMVPISISLVALLFLGERLSLRRGSGIVLAVAGVVSINVLSANGSAGGSQANVALGALLLVCSVLCEAVFVTFGKLLSTPMAPARLSLLLSVVGALMFLVPAGFESHWGADLLHAPWETWVLMIYTGVAINGIAVVLMYDSLDHVDTTVVAAFTALTPVSGAVLSILMLGEELHLYHVIGIALAVIGVFVVAKEKAAPPDATESGDDPEKADETTDGRHPTDFRNAVT